MSKKKKKGCFTARLSDFYERGDGINKDKESEDRPMPGRACGPQDIGEFFGKVAAMKNAREGDSGSRGCASKKAKASPAGRGCGQTRSSKPSCGRGCR